MGALAGTLRPCQGAIVVAWREALGSMASQRFLREDVLRDALDELFQAFLVCLERAGPGLRPVLDYNAQAALARVARLLGPKASAKACLVAYDVVLAHVAATVGGANPSELRRLWALISQASLDVAAFVETPAAAAPQQTEKASPPSLADTLARAQKQLSAVLDMAQLGYFDWDIVSDSIEFNPYFMRDWQLESGASIHTALGRIHERDRSRVSALLQEAVRLGTPFHTDYRVCRPDGITIWIEAQGMVFYDADKNPVRFIGTSRNVSERVAESEAAQDERRWFEQVLDRIPLPLIMVEPGSGNHVLVNRAAEAMRGQSFDLTQNSATYGENFYVCDAAGRRFTADEMPTTRAARGEILKNLEISWKTNGRSYDLLMSSMYMPACYGHPAVVVCPFQDVTALKESQRQLNRAIDELNLESDLRDKFVSALTHDLRTPLTAAGMSAQRLERTFGKEEKVAKGATRILTALSRIEQMIQQVLEANRIKAGHKLRIHPEQTQLGPFFADGVSELNSVHSGRIALSNHAEQRLIECDPSAMRRVLDNLVSNAVKYGDPDSAIRVDVAEEAGKIKINVHNHGPVIDSADQVNLFKPYFRAANALAGKAKGWGIGLALVKEIAEAHGGDVSVYSSVCEGTTFAVSLPTDA